MLFARGRIPALSGSSYGESPTADLSLQENICILYLHTNYGLDTNPPKADNFSFLLVTFVANSLIGMQ
jgi:hypothetical protein